MRIGEHVVGITKTVRQDGREVVIINICLKMNQTINQREISLLNSYLDKEGWFDEFSDNTIYELQVFNHVGNLLPFGEIFRG